MEEGARPRPYALVNGPPVILATEVGPCRALFACGKFLAPVQGGVSTSPVPSRFGVADLWPCGFRCPLQDSRGILCVSCVVRFLLEEAKRKRFLAMPSLTMDICIIYSSHLIPFCPWSDLIGSARCFCPFDLLPLAHLHRCDFFSHLTPI